MPAAPTNSVPLAVYMPVKASSVQERVTPAAMPFDVIAADDPGTGATVRGQVNANSLFLPDESGTDTMTVANLGQDFVLVDGLLVYLQVDMNDDGTSINEVSMVWNTDGFGDSRITFGGSGTTDDPYVDDQAFFPVAQVYDSDGTATHGGQVFTSGDATNSFEVVNLCSSHLAATWKLAGGRIGIGVIKTAATFD